MKFLKKFALLLVCLSLMFAMVACGDDAEDDEYDEEGGSGNEDDKDLSEAVEYLSSIEEEYAAANSVNMTAELEATVTEDDDTYIVYGEIDSSISRTDDGYDASILFECEVIDGKYSATYEVKCSLIDNIGYFISYRNGAEIERKEIDYNNNDLEGNAHISPYTAVLETLFGSEDIGLPEEVSKQFFDIYAEKFEDLSYKYDGHYVIESDLAETVVDIVDFINDFDIITVEELVNSILAQIDDSWTVRSIFDMIESNKEMTVEELYDFIDDSCSATIGMGIQEYYDKVVSSEAFINYIYAMYGASESYIEQIKNADIESMVLPYMDYTVDEMVRELTAQIFGQSMGTSTLISYVEDEILGMTIADLIKMEMSEREYNMFLSVVNNLNVDMLDFSCVLKADSANKFIGAIFYADVDFDCIVDGEYYSVEGSVDFDMNLSDSYVNIQRPY